MKSFRINKLTSFKTIKVYKKFRYSELKLKILEVEYFIRIHRTSSATMQIWLLGKVI